VSSGTGTDTETDTETDTDPDTVFVPVKGAGEGPGTVAMDCQLSTVNCQLRKRWNFLQTAVSKLVPCEKRTPSPVPP
jgi:hypothetical protein